MGKIQQQKADPEGAHLRPVPPRETGRTMVFLGIFLLVTGLITAMFVGWDIRAGVDLVRIALATQVVLGLVLIIIGWVKKKRS